MTRNVIPSLALGQPVISGDFRSPAVEPVPSGFDPLAMLADFRAFCAETPSLVEDLLSDGGFGTDSTCMRCKIDEAAPNQLLCAGCLPEVIS